VLHSASSRKRRLASVAKNGTCTGRTHEISPISIKYYSTIFNCDLRTDLRKFIEGTVSLFQFSPHICKHGGCNCSHSISYPPNNFAQCSGQWSNVDSMLYGSPQETMWCCKVTGTRWPSDLAALASPFRSKTFMQKGLNVT
jgi:hypothetical protein